MIEPTEIIPTLLDTCPGFKQSWEKHLEYWDGKEAGIFNDTAEFVHYMVRCYETGDQAPLPSVFQTIEGFLVQGTEDTKQITILGILETLQCVASHYSFGEDVFIPYLGPQSTEAWYELVQVWEGNHSLAEVIRGEFRGQI